MSSKTLQPPFRDESRDLHKHIGCMSGIFQIFDRHDFLVGRRSAAGRNHKRLLPAGANDDRVTNSTATEKATARFHMQGKNIKEAVQVQDQPRVSTESLGTSLSSSSCSSTFSSTDHSKAVRSRPTPFNHSSSRDQSPAQKPAPPRSSQQPSDLRDVVKDSMRREQRGVLVRTAAKEEGRGRTMKHIDSPRPIPHFKTGEPRAADVDRSNRILVKLREFPQNPKEARKDPPRFSSYDGREMYKPTTKLKELPRLSLDSRESSLKSSASESRLNFLLRELQRGNGTLSQIVNSVQEPGSNKRPSNLVVKLMGLEAFPDYVPHDDQEETVKDSRHLDDQDHGTLTRSLKKSEKVKKNPSVLLQQSAHNNNDPVSPVSRRASPRFPLEIAPWRQPDANHESPRTSQNMWNGRRNVTETPSSVYGEIEKRISELEFKKSGKDLRALKQILEAMQTTRKRLEFQEGEQTELKSQTQTNRFSSECRGAKTSELPKNQGNQLASMKGSRSPKRFNSPILITKSPRLADNRRISTVSVVPSANPSHIQKPPAREILCTGEDSVEKHIKRDPTPRKYTPQIPNKCKPSTDKFINGDSINRGPQQVKVEKYTAFGRTNGSASPRFQQKNHETEHQSSLITPTPKSGSRARRKLRGQLTEKDSPRRKLRQQSTSNSSKDKLRSATTESNNFSIQSDTASVQSESNCSLASLTETEVTSTESCTEIGAKQRVGRNERNGSARPSEDMRLPQLKIVSTEQPSPVSVLDASFYREDSPSPVRKTSTVFQDYETSIPDEAEWHCLDDENMKSLDKINNLVNKLRLLNTIPDEASMYQLPSICKSSTPDHKYITKVLLASGLLKDIGPISTTIQLWSPGHLINPDLYHVLEQAEQSTTKSASEEQKQSIVALKCDQKIHRKIVFDTVNEILIRKLASDGPFVPRKRSKTWPELLRELYSEMDRLQAKSGCSLVDDDDDDRSISILNADMMQQPDYWVDNQSEIPAVVLDVERLIFKDLITEVITAEALGLCDWPRGQYKCNLQH